MKTQQCCVGVALALATLAAHAQATTEVSVADQGFSYFLGLGVQNIQYRETASLLPVKTSVRTTSPLLVTGGLYVVNRDLMFTLNSESTYFGGNGSETWNATTSVINNVTLTSPLLQTNTASLTHNETQMLAHYRLQDDWFVVGGPTMRNQSFKRSSFDVPANLIASGVMAKPTLPTTEESVSELMLNVGVALESAQVKGRENHQGLRAIVGIPLVRRLENTNFPGVRFNGTRGYDLSLDGRYSWALHPGVHLGVWGRWTTAVRGSQNYTSDKLYELPRAELNTLGAGVELLWKL